VRLKLDENLPVSLRAPLAALGFDVDTVLDEALGGQPDDAVWKAAQAECRFFITQDLDFSDVRRFAPGTHAGILLLRVPEHQQRGVADLVIACMSAPEARTWTGCFVVATPSRFRVVRATPLVDGDDEP
jgi:predicted nuclease of predicted toxin-antitoxin system